MTRLAPRKKLLFRLNDAAGADIQIGMGVHKGAKNMGPGLQQDAGGCTLAAEAGESPHRLWVFVPESVSSAHLFPAAPEPLPDTAHMILDRKAEETAKKEKISTLELSNAARFVYVASNIPVRGNQAEPK